jgi:hypothetical protein
MHAVCVCVLIQSVALERVALKIHAGEKSNEWNEHTHIEIKITHQEHIDIEIYITHPNIHTYIHTSMHKHTPQMLHKEMSQMQRAESLAAFRTGISQTLISTDCKCIRVYLFVMG